MFKHYKKIFMLTLKSEFAEMITQHSFDNDNSKTPQENDLSYLRALQAAIADKKIDNEEALVISQNIENIEGEAKKGLVEIAKDMLKNGFSAKNELTYNAFKNILEKSGQKIPSWDDIISKLKEEHEEHSSGIFLSDFAMDDRFHGINIKNNKIEIRYDKTGTDDILELNHNEGELLTGYKDSHWKGVWGDEEDLLDKGTVDSSILDDNISKAETTVPAAETTVPAAETTVPAAETTVPAAETTVPAAETTVPAAETTVPAAETTVPAAETTVPAAEKQKFNLFTKNGLTVKDGEVHIKVKTPNGEEHTGFFIISKHPQIKDQASLNLWKNYIINYLNKKYPKIEKKKDKINVKVKSQQESQQESQQKSQNNLNLKSLQILDINPSQEVYDTSKLKSGFKIEKGVTKIVNGVITGEPQSIDKDLFYSLDIKGISIDKKGISIDKKVTLKGDKLQQILNRQKNDNERRNLKIAHRKTTLDYKGGKKIESSIDLPVEGLNDKVLKKLKDGKYDIDFVGLNSNHIILEKKGNNYTVSDKNDLFGDISIKPKEIEDIIKLLPQIMKEIKNAYVIEHKGIKGESFIKGLKRQKNIKEKITNFNYSRSIESLKNNQKELKNVLEIYSKK